MPAEKNRKFFDLRNGLKAVDFRNKDYFDRIDDKEKSLYSPYMLMRYVSSTSAVRGSFKGFVSHYHLTKRKIDCANLDLRKLLDEIK